MRTRCSFETAQLNVVFEAHIVDVFCADSVFAAYPRNNVGTGDGWLNILICSTSKKVFPKTCPFSVCLILDPLPAEIIGTSQNLVVVCWKAKLNKTKHASYSTCVSFI